MRQPFQLTMPTLQESSQEDILMISQEEQPSSKQEPKRMHYTVVDRLDEMEYQYTYHDSKFMGYMLSHTVWEDDRRIDYINKIIIPDQESTESLVWET